METDTPLWSPWAESRGSSFCWGIFCLDPGESRDGCWGEGDAALPGKGRRASGAGLRFRSRPRGAGFAPHSSPAAHPGTGMEPAPRGLGAAAVPGACGFQQTPSGQRPAAAQECRAQQVSAAVLTMPLRVPITAERLPRSSRPQSISSRSF